MQDEFLKNGSILSLDDKRLLVGWGKKLWSKEPKKGPRPQFYFPDFFLKIGCPWYEHEYYEVINAEDLDLAKLNEEVHWKLSTKEKFSEVFVDLKARFKKGGLQKAVPYIFERTESKMSQARLSSMLKHVLDYTANHPVHVYGMWNEGEGVLGATPEILFDYDKTLKTMACAGTFHGGEKNACSKKLLHEHNLVIDGIEESLSPFGTVQRGELQCCEFGSLGHLITPLELNPSRTLNYLKVVQALHPTPALGAYPKENGLQWLEKQQMHTSRGRFGAPVGFSYEGKWRCLVAIRNVQWDNMGMKIGAGCGVIAESDLDEEWNELQLKLKAIKGILGC